MLTPIEIYQRHLNTGEYEANSQQQAVIHQLQKIYEALLARNQTHTGFKKIFLKPKTIKGLYLWGQVGIGKTWLMDIFFESYHSTRKLRMHFHAFMRMIHQELTKLSGKKNPLILIAKHLAQKYDVLLFDELLVEDIGDAMLLNNLLSALLQQHLVIITTSNTAPDDLYRHGLQRDSFVPAIQQIKQHMEIMHIKNLTDYRFKNFKTYGSYFFPLDKSSSQKIADLFQHLSTHWEENAAIEINDRTIQTIRKASHIVWFDFRILCHPPRSAQDYLEIAKYYTTVFLSHVPAIAANDITHAQYFINLVDVFYDAKIKLVIQAEVPIDEIYVVGKLKTAFQRTRSRLHEMQTGGYWEK